MLGYKHYRYRTQEELESLGPEFGVRIGNEGGDYFIVPMADFVGYMIDAINSSGGAQIPFSAADAAAMEARIMENVLTEIPTP